MGNRDRANDENPSTKHCKTAVPARQWARAPFAPLVDAAPGAVAQAGGAGLGAPRRPPGTR